MEALIYIFFATDGSTQLKEHLKFKTKIRRMNF